MGQRTLVKDGNAQLALITARVLAQGELAFTDAAFDRHGSPATRPTCEVRPAIDATFADACTLVVHARFR